MDELQRKILEFLEKRKTDKDWPNLNTAWKECGELDPAVFMHARKVLLEQGLVIGNPTNQLGQLIVGTGRITPRGEEALRVSEEKPSTEELIDILPDRIKDHARKALAEFFRNVHEGVSSTLIVTTDGERWKIIDSAHPLPSKYLNQWQEDTRRFDIDMRLD
jgi:hypothetical protein